MKNITYCDAIREGFEYLLDRNSKSFVIGQGLWSPWYVGNSMLDLDKKFGRDRIIDCPVSELAVTGAALGAALNGYAAIVVHPRMDFMILAADQIVNQAAKWRHMLGGKANCNLTVRAIINRGGQQGAQHSQALHSWFAHIPGLRVLMPGTVEDARNMLIAAGQSNDPVIYIDDRWCYDMQDTLDAPSDIDIRSIQPLVRRTGSDVTIATAGHGVKLSIEAAEYLATRNIECEVVDIRQLGHFDITSLTTSVEKTKFLLALDVGWSNCGFSAELLARVAEANLAKDYQINMSRLTLPPSPAPCAPNLEENYYVGPLDVAKKVEQILAP